MHQAMAVSLGAPRDSLVPPVGAWCRRSYCNTHAIVLFGPTRAFSDVARVGVGVPDSDGLLDDVAQELSSQCVGPEHSM